MEPTPAEAAALAAAGGKKGNKGKKGTTVSLAAFQAGGVDLSAPLPSVGTRTSSWADEVADPVQLPTGPSSYSGYQDSSSSSSSSTFGGERNRGGDRGGYDRGDRGGERGGYGGDRGDRRERPSRPQQPQNELPNGPPYTAYVGNLPFNSTESSVKEFFQGSKVKSARFPLDRETQKPKGFGYIEFEDLDSLAKALQKNGEQLNGRSVRIDVATPSANSESSSRRSDNESNWRNEGNNQASKFQQQERRHRDVDPSKSDDADEWRRKDPLPEAEKQSHFDKKSSFGGGGGGGGGGGDRPRREFQQQQQQPQERKKLELKPRTAEPAKTIDELAESYKVSPAKPSPFGSAKPRDENEILQKKEEERKKRDEEKKKEQEEKAAKATSESAEHVAAKPAASAGSSPQHKKEKADRKPHSDDPTDQDWHNKSGAQKTSVFQNRNNKTHHDDNKKGGPNSSSSSSSSSKSASASTSGEKKAPKPQQLEAPAPAKVVNQFDVLAVEDSE